MDSSSFHTLRELRKQMHHSAAQHFQNIDLLYLFAVYKYIKIPLSSSINHLYPTSLAEAVLIRPTDVFY